MTPVTVGLFAGLWLTPVKFQETGQGVTDLKVRKVDILRASRATSILTRSHTNCD